MTEQEKIVEELCRINEALFIESEVLKEKIKELKQIIKEHGIRY